MASPRLGGGPGGRLEPERPGEPGARAGLTTGPTTRLIDRLEQAGYVRRSPAPDDRRKVIVEPVGKPAELDEVMTPVRREVGEILAGCTDDQLDVPYDYFRRAARAYERAAERLRVGS